MSKVCLSLRLPLLAVFVALVAFGFSNSTDGARAHSGSDSFGSPVEAWNEAHPGEPLPVILRFAGDPSDATAFIRSHGGAIEHELPLLNAVSATVPAELVDDLALRADVAGIDLDAPVKSTILKVEKDKFLTKFQKSTMAKDVFDKAMGQGVGVAVIDTGISSTSACDFADLSGACGARIVARYSAEDGVSTTSDGFGHGTHIANTIGGYSFGTNGQYGGMAPLANLISVKIDDDEGNSSIGDVVAGLSWVLENRDAYNIKVVNLSLTSSVQQSYKTDPLDAAMELLWFNGITVVAAAGNSPDAYNYAPANDPFVITVGAVDEHAEDNLDKHTVPSWSSRGITADGVSKPDVYAPGAKIAAGIDPESMIATTYPGGIVGMDNGQARYAMSGTSMATAVVSGGVALLAQRHPDWSPGQIKKAIVSKSKALRLAPNARELQVKPAFELNAVTDASVGIVPNYLLLDAAGTCDTTIVEVATCPVEFDKISWGSVDFQKISWSKISWSKISWSKISWGGGVDLAKISWSKISWGKIDQ